MQQPWNTYIIRMVLSLCHEKGRGYNHRRCDVYTKLNIDCSPLPSKEHGSILLTKRTEQQISVCIVLTWRARIPIVTRRVGSLAVLASPDVGNGAVIALACTGRERERLMERYGWLQLSWQECTKCLLVFFIEKRKNIVIQPRVGTAPQRYLALRVLRCPRSLPRSHTSTYRRSTTLSPHARYVATTNNVAAA